MKSMRTFIIAVIVLFVAMMFIEMATPRHFSWEPTYTHVDEQPFGCALFDSVMAGSLTQGYTTSTLTLSQLEKVYPATERHLYLIIASNEPLSKTDQETMLRMLSRGDQFLMATGSFEPEYYDDDFGFQIVGYANPWASMLKSEVLEKDYDTLTWMASTGPYGSGHEWHVPLQLNEASVVEVFKSGIVKPLVTYTHFDNDRGHFDDDLGQWIREPGKFVTDTTAAIMQYGKGKLLVSANPLMFTNYGIIEYDGATMALRCLSMLERYPVVRLDPMAKTEAAGVSESPLRYVLRQPPMLWATWLLVLTVVLAMVFTARRRQRVIPVIEPPVNRALEMVKHIGSLYFHRHDNADLLAKKYQFFVEEVRRLTMIDLNDESHIDDAYLQLQYHSGIARDELRQQLQNIVGWTSEQPTDRTLMQCIDYLNHVLSKLK